MLHPHAVIPEVCGLWHPGRFRRAGNSRREHSFGRNNLNHGNICHIRQPDGLYFADLLFGHMFGLCLIADLELPQPRRTKIEAGREHLLYPDRRVVGIRSLARAL